MKNKIIFFFICCFSLLGAKSAQNSPDRRHIFYLLSAKEIDKALDLYLQYYETSMSHDFEILKEIGHTLIDMGTDSHDLDEQLLTIYGISLSGDSRSLPFLEKAMLSTHPGVQGAALHLLGQIYEDGAVDLMNKGLSSDFLQIRFEALHHLIVRKTKSALGQADALRNLLPHQFKSLFVEFYALYGSQSSIQQLKQLFNDDDSSVRIAAILSAANYGRDDLLANIRAVMTHTDPAIKETAASSLGILRDLRSVDQLKLVATSPFAETKLAALLALHRLGDSDAKNKIIEMAEGGSSFAAFVLREIPEGQKTLEKLVHKSDKVLALNAANALLKSRNSAALPAIKEILNADTSFVGFAPQSSGGRSLVIWKTVSPSLITGAEAKRNLEAISQNFQEELLRNCIDLPHSDFIDVARYIFEHKQYRLVPLLVRLLENVATSEARNLLQEKANEVGAPLIRSYCNLALYRMGEDRGVRRNFLKWIESQEAPKLIEFRPMMDRGAREDQNSSNYELTPEEKSGVIIEAFDALASKHDIGGISLILRGMRDGHPKNRYAFAGLLLKSIQ